MKRRNRSRTRAIISSPVTLVLALVILFFAARSSANIHSKTVESSMRLADAQANLSRLETKTDILRTEIAQLSTKEGIEASIREKYHAVEPGESVAVIITEDDTRAGIAGAAGSAATTTTQPEPGFWKRLFSRMGF